MGGHHLALGQNAHAEHYLRQAIELDPEAPRPRLLLCLALLGFNQPVVSSQTYREEIESQFDWLQRNRSGAPEVEWLGHYLELEHSMRRGDWQSGIGQGRIAVEKFPDNYLLQFMCGLALIHFGQTDGLTRGDFREALRRIRMSVELNPEFEPAVKNVRVLEDLAARAPA